MLRLFKSRRRLENEIKKDVEDFISKNIECDRKIADIIKQIHEYHVCRLIEDKELGDIPRKVIITKYFELRPGIGSLFRDACSFGYREQVKKILINEYHTQEAAI